MKNVVAYCRVSTDEKDQLHSLETQKEFFEAYALKHEMNLIHIYSDAGISGTKTKNRAAFHQMMRDAETGSFTAILIKDVSRLARNTVVLLESCRKLRSMGIEIQFLNYLNIMGNSEFLLTLYAAMAQEESYHTSKRIKFSKKFNAEKGKVPNFVFGYDKIIGDYFHLNVNEKEAATVRLIFQKYTADGDGTLTIAHTLNDMGITTKRGCQWTQHAVARILKNPIYIGKIVNGKQENVNFPDTRRKNLEEKDFIVVENEALRILDDVTFAKAQKLLEQRRHTFAAKQTRHSNQYLFSTLIRCAECGSSFRRITRTYRNTYIRWVCSGRNGRGKDTCENAVSIDEAVLSDEIQKYFQAMLSDKDMETAEATLRQLCDRKNKTDDQKETLEKKLSEMKRYREKMLQLFVAELISLEEFQEKTAEIPRLEQELQRLSVASEQKNTADAAERFFQNRERMTDIRLLSNTQMKSLIREIKVDKDGHIDIVLNVLSDTPKSAR